MLSSKAIQFAGPNAWINRESVGSLKKFESVNAIKSAKHGQNCQKITRAKSVNLSASQSLLSQDAKELTKTYVTATFQTDIYLCTFQNARKNLLS